MRIQTQLAFLSLFAVAAIAHTDQDQKLVDDDLSLPDLELLDALNAPTWKIGGNSAFEAGRLVLTPVQNTRGYAVNDISIAYDSFTLEAVFRSTGQFGKTGSGLSFRYVKEHDTTDTSFFGGPANFDGLNVVVDSNGPVGSSIHVFLNDGTVDFTKLAENELYQNAIGFCLVSYQDSQVPVTLRISSYNGIFLVQVNNRICLKTQKVKIPKEYKVGLSATTKVKHERFELLRLKTYGGVLSEIIENDGKIAPQPKVVTKYIKLDDQGAQVDEPSSKLSSGYFNALETIQRTNQDILSKFNNLESRINGLSSIDGNGKEVDFSFLDEYTKQLKALTDHIFVIKDNLKSLDQKFYDTERALRSEINVLTSTINKVNDQYAIQLRSNQKSYDELSKNIQFLVESENDRQQNPVHELIGGLKYLIFPILIIVGVLSFFTYRLRREIKSKLL